MLANVSEAKAHLSELLERVAKGEEIIIGKAGKPVARLVPYSPSQEPRKWGQWAGKVQMAEDFEAPLPPEIMKAFQGEGN